MFPELFLRYLHKSEKNGKNDQISYFYLRFWFKIELLEGQYLKNSSGNMSQKFYYGLCLLKIINGYIVFGGVFFLGIDFGSTCCATTCPMAAATALSLAVARRLWQGVRY